MEEKRAVSSKGQVVVPKAIRDYMDLKEGDELKFCVKETGEIVISPVKGNDPTKLFASLPSKGAGTGDFEQVLQQSKEERLNKRKREGKI
jgi:AbrB family looped-hinge helix DNA binding protein